MGHRHAHRTLNILSDLATPHNNSLIRALLQMPGLKVQLYYAMRSYEALPWKRNMRDEMIKAEVFGEHRVNFRLLWYAVTHGKERYLLVGWANPTMRAILIVLWVLNRPFMFWADHPDETKARSVAAKSIRRLFFYILRCGASHVFGVGRHTVRYFERRGIPEGKLTNLPIFIELPKRGRDSFVDRQRIRSKYCGKDGEILFVAGSRFTYSKGYDLVIRATALIDIAWTRNLRLLLVGHGPEEPVLRGLIQELHLEHNVYIESWMEPDQFEMTIAAGDVFVHPARFDAFGGGTLHAMALGLPVIGSDGAGAVVERVVHGTNGLIFASGDIEGLADSMALLLRHPERIEAMGEKARQTAEEWPPARGARILFDAVCQ